jgi:hypothetical protein
MEHKMKLENALWKIPLVSLFALTCLTALAIAYSFGPPTGRTGDSFFAGESVCTECHADNPLNAPGGTLTISGVPAQYVPGTTYPITVTISRSGQQRWGFQLAVRTTATQTQAGTLTATDPERTFISLESTGVQYISHNTAGTLPGAPQGSWTFNWTAPDAALGELRFSCAANAANGNFTNFGDFIYTAVVASVPQTGGPPDPEFATTLFYPRLITTNGSGGPTDDSQFTGIALANLDSTDATIRFTAFGTNGAPLAGAGVTNPASLSLRRGQQLPIVDVQVFGNALANQNPVGWFKVESTVPKTVGFFLMFDRTLTTQDGADVSSNTLTSAVFPEVAPTGFTQIHVANPGAAEASVTFDLVNANGEVRSTVARTLASNGAVAERLSDLFNLTPAGSDYLRAAANSGVVAFEFLAIAGEDAAAANAQDANAGAATLYSPQYVVGDPWRSTLSIINLDPSNAATVQLRFIRDDGTQIGVQRSVDIPARGKAYITDQNFFSVPPGLVQGYVEIRSNGPRLAGTILFSGRLSSRTSNAALPLTAALNNAVVFSQLASDLTYFTGIAILNPNEPRANVTVEAFDAEGAAIVSRQITVNGRQRISQVLTEIFPQLADQNRSNGYVRLTSDQPIASFALFGTRSLTVLSAVPPQVVP